MWRRDRLEWPSTNSFSDDTDRPSTDAEDLRTYVTNWFAFPDGNLQLSFLQQRPVSRSIWPALGNGRQSGTWIPSVREAGWLLTETTSMLWEGPAGIRWPREDALRGLDVSTDTWTWGGRWANTSQIVSVDIETLADPWTQFLLRRSPEYKTTPFLLLLFFFFFFFFFFHLLSGPIFLDVVLHAESENGAELVGASICLREVAGSNPLWAEKKKSFSSLDTRTNTPQMAAWAFVDAALSEGAPSGIELSRPNCDLGKNPVRSTRAASCKPSGQGLLDRTAHQGGGLWAKIRCSSLPRRPQ